MAREYRERDGTLDNVGDRIVSDYYNDEYDCDSYVGDHATRCLTGKLEKDVFKTLGFDKDTLTVPVETVSFQNQDAIDAITNKLDGIGVFIPDAETDIWMSYETKRKYLKEYKREYTLSTYEERIKHYSMLEARVEHCVKTWWVSLFQLEGDLYAIFRNNEPSKALFGLKPSKFLSRYIERLIPGITEEYALALSETHTLNVELTIDPNIMINCSQSATFSSCYTFDGEYHYSAQRYANSADSLMAVVFNDDGKILYRNWIFVSNNKESVITLYSYSSIRGSVIVNAVKKATRKFILGTDQYGFIEDPDISIENTYNSYIDSYTLATLQDTRVWNGSNHGPSLGEAICVDGGCTTDDECIGNKVCEYCEDGYRASELYYVEDYGDVCEYCRDNNFTWVESEDRHIHDDYIIRNVHDVPFHSDDICDDHAQSYYCNEWYPNDEIATSQDTHRDIPIEDMHYDSENDEYYEHEDSLQEVLEQREAEEELV